MADGMDCGDFGVTYGCKYVICVKKKKVLSSSVPI